MGATTTGCALLGLVLVVCGCPRVDAFACGDGIARCDLRDGGVCVDGWCAYPDLACPSDLRWHGDAPGVGGACVPVEGDTEPVGSTGVPGSTTPGASSSATEPESSSGAIPMCEAGIAFFVDTLALAGTEVLEGYPLLVDLVHPTLDGARTLAFTDARGEALAFELELLDGANGHVRAWVVLPAWIPGEPLELRLRVDDPDVVPPEDASAVWPEGFVGVWHLDDPLTGGARDRQLDSSAHANHGLVLGGLGPEQIVPGVIGEAVAFDGIDDEVRIDDATFVGTLGSSTISVWARVDADGSGENPFFSRVNGDNLYPRCRTRPDTDGALQCQTQVAGVPLALRADADEVPRGEWHHVAITFDADTGRFALYANGALAQEGMLDAAPQDGDRYAPQLGVIEEFGHLLGVLDEFRVVDRPLSPAWIAADAVSQRDPRALTSDATALPPVACP